MPGNHVQYNRGNWKPNKKIESWPYDEDTVEYNSSKREIKEKHWFLCVFLNVLCFPLYVEVDSNNNED